ncbi:LAMI_0E15830g1_1 [Lachancea mirantina]|uniref:non-specific serine/threonine protein kinase n=1 Tax=Lachancea mirantina TaxID=1230905 RepID=A0A1G4JSK1_9SACH|nr:LAMI_0E15830g1_1 [Lachancea mirantina]
MATRVNLTPAQRPPGAGDKTASKGATHYALKQVVGKGAYGIVYRAINRHTSKEVAIKVIEYDQDEELNEHMLEIDLLKNLRHKNIVKYHGFIQKSHQLFILLEYCAHGSLRDLVKRTPLDESQAKPYIRQTLEGLKYLHDQGVIHRDIKAANLLLDSEYVVKLADFGVSTRVNYLPMTYAGSPNWMAPEVMAGNGASTVSDIWSLGATLVELLTGNPPFHNLINEAACYAIVHDTYIPPQSFSQQCQAFLRTCFNKNLFKRPPARELLDHEWLTESRHAALDRFREDDKIADNWDRDFIEVEVSPTKKPDVCDASYHLELLSRAQSDCVPHLVFAECDLHSVIMCLVELCSRGQTKNVRELLRYDMDYNKAEGKDLFIALGGLPHLTTHSAVTEPILADIFLDDAKELIKCNVLSICKLLTDPRLILHIASSYSELIRHNYWCQWCAGLPNLMTAIVRGLRSRDRIAEDLLLRLSSSPEYPIDKKLIEELMKLPLDNSRLKYIIFKSFNNILLRREEDRIDSAGSFESRPPLMSFKSSRPRSASSLILPPFSARSPISEGFLEWLFNFIPGEDDDLHLIKNFIELCFNVAHLNTQAISEVASHRSFLKLIKQVLSGFHTDYHNRKYIKSILLTAVDLCVELSQELDEVSLADTVQIGLQFSGTAEFATGGTDILLHCLQFAMRARFPVIENDTSMIIRPPRSKEIPIPRAIFLKSFYSEEAKFGNYITKITKLCSLPPCKSLALEIVSNAAFMDKIRSLFEVYGSSLIIQIDLLKFLKVILTRYTSSISNKNQSTLSTEEIIRGALNQPHSEPNIDVISQVAAFLQENWTPVEGDVHKVGADSVLIKQLCEDIKALKAVNIGTSRPPDKDEFTIPRFNPI